MGSTRALACSGPRPRVPGAGSADSPRSLEYVRTGNLVPVYGEGAGNNTRGRVFSPSGLRPALISIT